jgi:hypothetical protein
MLLLLSPNLSRKTYIIKQWEHYANGKDGIECSVTFSFIYFISIHNSSMFILPKKYPYYFQSKKIKILLNLAKLNLQSSFL